MPPSDNCRLLPYPIQLPAATDSNPTPYNGNRNYLLIQNQGANPLLVSFGRPAGQAIQPYIIPGASEKEWTVTVPVESINIFSTLGTVGTIWEGTPP